MPLAFMTIVLLMNRLEPIFYCMPQQTNKQGGEYVKKAIIQVFIFCCLISGCTTDDFEEKEIIVDREIIVEEKNIANAEMILNDNEENSSITNEQSLTEEKVSIAIDTDNPYFFRQSLLTANVKFPGVRGG